METSPSIPTRRHNHGWVLMFAISCGLCTAVPLSVCAAPCNQTPSSPTIFVVSPQNDAMVAGRSALRAFVDDKAADIHYVEVYVNDRESVVLQAAQFSYASETHKHKIEFSVPIYVSLVEKSGDIRLSPGKNSIKLFAYTIDGRCGLEEIRVQAALQEVYAVVVGISQYEHVPKLSWAHQDAQMFKDYLEGSLRIPSDNITLLQDGRAKASEVKSAVEIAINKARKLGKQGTFIFFFSGHGFQDNIPSTERSHTGSTFLVLHDGKLNSPVSTMLDLFKELYNDIMQTTSDGQLARALVFVDACNSGGLTGSKGLVAASGPKSIPGGGLRDVWPQWTGSYVMASSKGDEISFEEDSLHAGVFTHFLLRAFSEADDKNGVIYLSAVYDYVKKEVSQYVSREHGGNSQSPQFSLRTGNLEDFPIGYKRKATSK
jgi:hypothetical protein